ncbi:isoprenylcysteine carboxylmethyltransferase family protein [Vibrio sp. T187]|uniref:methyltransferase family protein n=1 Tax=Vibrio TaxID=662 RepID=UPI0010C96654|nr:MULTISPECIES: isoprenylcysteine carboxylmethyltransferase family protein [Vibrio]MBW3696820.1 isoprenylcysteine carboxylmethyltransferase family protein [Vibrio sp. T187]
MKYLELKVPPVALFVLMFVLSYYMSKQFVNVLVEFPFPLQVFSGLVLISTYIGLAGVYEFKKRKTTVNPIKPEQASLVVDSGIFAYTRNPMYLGLFLVLFGFGYYLQNFFSISLSCMFVLYMNQFQIKPEERALEALFGASYVDYKQRVRRWV